MKRKQIEIQPEVWPNTQPKHRKSFVFEMHFPNHKVDSQKLFFFFGLSAAVNETSKVLEVVFTIMGMQSSRLNQQNAGMVGFHWHIH